MTRRFVDLSITLCNDVVTDPPFLKPHIDYEAHNDTRNELEMFFPGVKFDEMRGGDVGFCGAEWVKLTTHSGTHVDAPWHYNSETGGKPSQTIDELPLEWFHAPGVRLDFTSHEDGDAITADQVRSALQAVDHELKPLDIVLVHTGRDEFLDADDYMIRGPGVTAEATHWMYEQGVRVMGIDAWGWDRPLHLQAAEAVERNESGIFWAAHQADLAYSQIERLANLSSLPATGFTLACFPLRLVGGSAAPARVVGIVD